MPDPRRYILSEEAELQLSEIFDYTAQKWSIQQAEKYLLTIESVILDLCSETTPGRQHAFIPSPFRVATSGEHLIVFRSKNDLIEVIAILHAQMDLTARFKELKKKRKI